MAYHFPDRNQNFWQLTCIQSASQSIPGLLVGGILSRQYGPKTAILSICVGNLILWLIGLGVISMAFKERKNAVENVRGFLGKGSSIAMAVILIIAFLSWYMLEIHSSMEAIAPLFKSTTKEQLNGIGAALGVIIAILAMGGIRLIRHTCVIAFPFLLAFVLFGIVTSNFRIIGAGTWGLSFSAVLTVAATTLPGTVNLPTFFRHSKSRADSLMALTLMTVFDSLFQIYSAFAQMNKPADLLGTTSNLSIYNIVVFVFILATLFCLNLVNIYFASAGLELIFPRLANAKGYILVGLFGTGTYILLKNYSPMMFLENLADNFIVSLGVVLLISCLIRIVVKHRPRAFEKLVNSICWAIGCLAALVMQIYFPQDPNMAMIAGICGSALSFLLVVFVEETVWAVKKLNLLKES